MAEPFKLSGMETKFNPFPNGPVVTRKGYNKRSVLTLHRRTGSLSGAVARQAASKKRGKR